MIGPIALIEAVATLLWAYAGVAFLAWLWHLRRQEKQTHIPHIVDLLANLVPAMVMLLVVVIAGAVIGLPSVVVIIAVLFPAGLAFGVQMTLNDLRDRVSPRQEILRIMLAMVIGAGVIWWRQIA